MDEDDRAVNAAAPTVPTVAAVDTDPAEKAAKKLDSWKTILWIFGGLVVLGGVGALYLERLATKNDVHAMVTDHEAGTHAAMAVRVGGVENAEHDILQRLSSVETAQKDMRVQQNKIEDKLDWIILTRTQPVAAVPAPPAPRTP